jgi:hypothetical protein
VGWIVPWQRIREADGRLKSRQAEGLIEVQRNARYRVVNGLFRAEGGLMSADHALEERHFDLAGDVRRLRAQGVDI